jgi:hypothetical protein
MLSIDEGSVEWGDPHQIDTNHYIPHVLHLTIGKGNDVLNNFILELQAI